MVYFRQLFEPRAHGYAYLLADLDRLEAVIVDPAAGQAALYVALLGEIHTRLTHVLLTHAHGRLAEGAHDLCAATTALLVAHPHSGLERIDVAAVDRAAIAFGAELVHCRSTPGHTGGCVSYLWRDRVFTGDALLIGDCGAPAADDGDAGMLFDSVTRQLLTLPDETLVYPGHDFAGRRVSCIAEQRETNQKLAGTTRDEFVAKHRPSAYRNAFQA